LGLFIPNAFLTFSIDLFPVIPIEFIPKECFS